MSRLIDYVLYRHGSNRANQSLCGKRPVAIVSAPNQTVACETERRELKEPPYRLDVHAPSYSVLAPDVEVWANQYLTAVPVSRAPTRDVLA